MRALARQGDRMRTRVSTGILIFLFFFSIYSLTMTGRIRFGDEGERYLTAQSLVERQDLSIRVQPDLHRKIGVDGRNYSSYELGSILPLVPFYALGKLVSMFSGSIDPNQVEMLITGLFNPAVTALTAVVLYGFCLALDYSAALSWLCTMLYGLASIAWPYSKAFEREPLLGFCLLLSTFAIYQFRRYRQSRWFWTAGLGIAFLIFGKLANVILLPFFAGYFLIVIYEMRKTRSITQILWTCILFGAPTAVLIGVQGVSNQIRFGSFTDIGLSGTWGNPISYFGLSNLVAGLGGMLFSPGKSIFLYSVPALLSVPAWFPFFKQHKLEAVLTGLLISATLIFNAMNVNWEQPSWWGPRYLVPVIPLFLLPVGALVSRSRGMAKRVWLFLMVAAGAIGICIQLIAAFVDDREYLDVTASGIDLPGAIEFLRHGAFESLVFYRSPVGFPFDINPFGIAAGLVAAFLIVWITSRFRSNAVDFRFSRLDLLVLVLIVLFELGSLFLWIVGPYPQVLAAQGNTKLVAGDLFLADNRTMEAYALYLIALDRGTTFPQRAVAQLETINPPSRGLALSTDDLMAALEVEDGMSIRRDDTITLSGEGALRISIAPRRGSANATAISIPIPVQPNTVYELSGWMKTEGVYGDGYAVVSLREDNGTWGNALGTDIAATNESGGWHPFRKTITTQPTTRRVFVASGLWKTFGTVWVEGLELAEKTN